MSEDARRGRSKVAEVTVLDTAVTDVADWSRVPVPARPLGTTVGNLVDETSVCGASALERRDLP